MTLNERLAPLPPRRHFGNFGASHAMRLQVKKRQQRVTMILDSKSITYDLVDITEPGKEDEKAYMQTNSKTKDGSKNALPPQIFNDDVYCGVSLMMSDVCVLCQTIAPYISRAIGMLVYTNGYRQYKNNTSIRDV